jgi:hypothetical protein
LHIADDVHQTTPSHPTGALAVPDHDPNWDYNTQAGLTLWDQFATCLLAGLKWASQKAINFEKLQEIIQDRTETPAPTFLDRLTRALQQYTNIDPESTDSRQLLMTYFFSQSYPDISAIVRGPLTPQTEVLATAFKVFHSQDEKVKCQKYQMLAQAMRSPNPEPEWGNQHPPNRSPPGPCFKCGKEGHWARFCPYPRMSPRPCPRCHAHGHWATDCPGSCWGLDQTLAPVPTS